jgi:thymidine kinase
LRRVFFRDVTSAVQALPRDIGWIEVITGPMFSGKTEELIRRLRRAVYARQKVEIFKPTIDTRYDAIEIVSHTRQSLVAQPVEDAAQILEKIDDHTQVVGIDEAQFFGRNLLETGQKLANRGLRVIVAGLDQDFRGVPFEPMPSLLAVAEFVTKNLAICMRCGNPAGRSQRLVRQDDRVVLGASEAYEARCRRCHTLEEALPAQERLFR